MTRRSAVRIIDRPVAAFDRPGRPRHADSGTGAAPDDVRQSARAITRLPSVLWRRAGSIRARSTIAAMVVVGVALTAAAVTVVMVLRSTVTHDVRNAGLLRAMQIAEAVADSGGRVPSLADQDGELVQVVDGLGRVVGESAALTDAALLPRPGPGNDALTDALVDDGHYLVVQAQAARPGSPGAPFSVLVAEDLDDAVDPLTSLTVTLMVLVPMLVLLVGGITWRVTGRALAPVETLHQQVDAITAKKLDRRVSNPGGADEIVPLATSRNRLLDRLQRSQAQRGPAQTDIDDVRSLATAEETQSPLHRRPVDIDALVLAEAGYLRASTDHQIETHGESAGVVIGDRLVLGEVLRQLGQHAAAHARGRICFTVEPTPDRVRLVVEDDGTAVGSDVRAAERPLRTSGAEEGLAADNGLGSAIAARLVRAHGGCMTSDTGPLGGARVVVDLPRGPDQVAPLRRRRQSGVQRSATAREPMR
jgi:signal transduction histidine kinase